MTRMSTFDDDELITVTPLRTFPVIQSLVTNVNWRYAKAREVPSFAPLPDLAPGEYRMQQVDVHERSQEFRKCIECYLCQDTPATWSATTENKPAFSGPRYLMRVGELEMHPLDVEDRRKTAQDDHGLGYGNITKCCTEVCPEHIKITDNALSSRSRSAWSIGSTTRWSGWATRSSVARVVTRSAHGRGGAATPPTCADTVGGGSVCEARTRGRNLVLSARRRIEQTLRGAVTRPAETPTGTRNLRVSHGVR